MCNVTLSIWHSYSKKMMTEEYFIWMQKLYSENRKEKIELLKGLTLGKDDTANIHPLKQVPFNLWTLNNTYNYLYKNSFSDLRHFTIIICISICPIGGLDSMGRAWPDISLRDGYRTQGVCAPFLSLSILIFEKYFSYFFYVCRDRK